MTGIIFFALSLGLAWPAFAEPVKDVPPIKVTLADGSEVTGVLFSDNGMKGAVPEYYIRSVVQKRGVTLENDIPLSREDGRDIVNIATQFAKPRSQYSVARSTDGYSAGTAQQIQLTMRKEGGLQRYSDRPEADEKRLAKEAAAKDPLFVSVQYSFQDAEREPNPGTGKMDPHGRIEMGPGGEVVYTLYVKPIRVFENSNDKPALAGEFPSIEAALEAARRGETAGLRFAADFGPQFNGVKMEGRQRPNQLMPLIPLGRVTKPGTKEPLIVALPPDQLQAYRRGEIPAESLLLIPPSALRYVPDAKHWGEVVDDYFELRSTGRDPARIFVANRRGGDGSQRMAATMNSVAIFGKGEPEGGDLKQSLRILRSEVPKSILDLDLGSLRKKKPGSGDCKFGDMA